MMMNSSRSTALLVASLAISISLEAQTNDCFAKLARSSEGQVVLDFVVDTFGHIDPASVHEVWPEGVKHPIGEEGTYYRNFLAATIRGVPTGEYKPATVGGCPINQRVRQSFDFKLAQ